MTYGLYKDANHSQIWGSVTGFGDPVKLKFTILLGILGGSQSGQETIYGIVPGNQSDLAAGNYISNFNGANAKLSFKYNASLIGLNTYPETCGADNQGTFPFTVTAIVNKACTIAADPMSFGPVSGLLDMPQKAKSTIQVTCTNGTDYDIGLNNGSHYGNSSRRMADGSGHYIKYQLYRDSGRTQGWGDTRYVDTLGGTGNGLEQTQTVYGRVPPQSPKPSGTYTDTVQIRVYY